MIHIRFHGHLQSHSRDPCKHISSMLNTHNKYLVCLPKGSLFIMHRLMYIGKEFLYTDIFLNHIGCYSLGKNSGVMAHSIYSNLNMCLDSKVMDSSWIHYELFVMNWEKYYDNTTYTKRQRDTQGFADPTQQPTFLQCQCILEVLPVYSSDMNSHSLLNVNVFLWVIWNVSCFLSE